MPKCFVISPIADDTTPERQFIQWKANYLPEFVVKPAVEAVGYEALRMDRDLGGRMISEAMIQGLGEYPLAVALLGDYHEPGARPDFNPNVVYEIGLRHAWCLPVVILTPVLPEELPFDFRDCPVVRHEIIEAHPEQPANGKPWGEEQVNSLQSVLTERLHSLLHVRQGGGHCRFQNVLGQRSQPYSLALILKSKRRALEEYRNAIFRFRHDFEEDYEMRVQDEQAFSELSKLLKKPTDGFFSDMNAYRRITMDQLSGVRNANQVMRVCDQMEEVIQQASLLLRFLQKPSESSDLAVAQATAGQKIRKILEIIEICLTAAMNLEL